MRRRRQKVGNNDRKDVQRKRYSIKREQEEEQPRERASGEWTAEWGLYLVGWKLLYARAWKTLSSGSVSPLLFHTTHPHHTSRHSWAVGEFLLMRSTWKFEDYFYFQLHKGTGNKGRELLLLMLWLGWRRGWMWNKCSSPLGEGKGSKRSQTFNHVKRSEVREELQPSKFRMAFRLLSFRCFPSRLVTQPDRHGDWLGMWATAMVTSGWLSYVPSYRHQHTDPRVVPWAP